MSDIKLLKKYLQEQGKPLPELVFLTVGRMQVGKSSVINSIVGKEVAEIGVNIDAETKKVRAYTFTVEDIECKVFDTPGFFDGSIDLGSNEHHIQQIRNHVLEFHCLLFVSRLFDPFSADETQTIRLISEAFGADVWKNAVIVFTYADHYRSSEKYRLRLAERAERFRKEVAIYYQGPINKIPFVGVDNTTNFTPDGKTWKDILITAIFTKIKDEGFLQVAIITSTYLKWTDRINYQSITPSMHKGTNADPESFPSEIKKNDGLDRDKKFVFLSKEQLQEILDRVKISKDLVHTLGDFASAISVLFGGPAKLIGKAIGYLYTLTKWLVLGN